MNKSLKIIILVLLVTAVAQTANAAFITFDAGGTTVGAGAPFYVDVKLDTSLPINAITLVIPLPVGVELVGSSDANSIVSLWVEKPAADSDRRVTLSGLIPGGFAANGGQLTRLYLRSAQAGSLRLSTASESAAYVHAAEVTTDPVSSRPLTLNIVEGRENTGIDMQDLTSPEEFEPAYVNLGEAEEELWAVGFFAQDKGSGIKEYYVAESKKNIALDNREKLALLQWRPATSPAELQDQKLKSYVYVKAVDLNGNERVAKLAPGAKWYERPIGYILITVLLVGVLYAFFSRKNKSPRS